MRIAFAGTPEFARQALAALIEAGHEVVCVLTQPDRPSGRGMKCLPSPVKQAAIDAGIPVLQPRSLRLDGKYPEDAQGAEAALRALAPDVMVVAAYGLILPRWVLDLPRCGCLNIHASLLPRWRGAAPIQRAIEAGDAASGVTIMQMDEGLDTGDMLHRVERPLAADETGASLHDRLAADGAQAIVDVLARLDAGDAPTPVPQPEAGVCYADKLLKSESALDFSRPATELARRVRAFDPFPGTTMALPGLDAPLKVWGAQVLTNQAGAGGSAPGTIVGMGPDGIDVATADGVLRVTVVQKPGGRRQPVAEFMRAYRG
ncbi:MAG: methionyl-tRNA formyltransferase [Castellaniella sp.]|uniref:methionyl-tRNA formyltransferase n=1 Tax=Castellaniella sp. TaxID=1955812 RepID=UPI002A36E81A|nr:methionyl-tRNA formyltransferase [Castellaniella sp.]MDY0308263.1 methionyl-tRNA formyltransferase [Castellaniella sp.]